MQTKAESIIEEVVKTAIKFIVALAITRWIIWPLIASGYIQQGDAFVMTLIFTVSSLSLSILLRRYFNAKHKKPPNLEL